MRVFGLVSPRETGRAFLCVVVTSRLLNIEVGGRHDDAVCGHFVAGLQLNDIANDEPAGRWAVVLDAEGKPLSVREALALINQTLDEALAEQEGDFDEDEA